MAFSAQAQTPIWKQGKISNLWVDPSDVVLELNIAGPCGTNLYHIQRTSPNFQEMAALMLTGGAQARTVEVYVTSCSGDRNVVSHGAVNFQ